MFRAVVFLAGPSRFSNTEKSQSWSHWKPLSDSESQRVGLPDKVYIADAGLNSFLSWYEELDYKSQSHIKSIHWCGDGDSLGDKGREFLSQTAARFEGRWRAHLYDT
ncbi:MAG: hypothetical protein RJB13_1883, partial [Pseudomonadota bacterium]